jgi:WD40 repeat protein
VNLAKPASAAVLDAQTGIVTRIFIPAQAEFVTDALLSPDGEHLLTRQSFMDRQTFKGEQHFCSLWDVSSGQELHRWQEENFGVVNTCAGFSSDGQVVSIIAGNGIRSLWSAETGNLIRQFK